mmetsp:Transcript_822/g.1812  ORF Transcript_822/g.1812 Transcript_822/m.1812 type:complete len:402 (+) Transcript_822:91-1296(+)
MGRDRRRSPRSRERPKQQQERHRQQRRVVLVDDPPPKQQQRSRVQKRPKTSKTLCRYILAGKQCRWGDRCRYSHAAAGDDVPRRTGAGDEEVPRTRPAVELRPRSPKAQQTQSPEALKAWSQARIAGQKFLLQKERAKQSEKAAAEHARIALEMASESHTGILPALTDGIAEPTPANSAVKVNAAPAPKATRPRQQLKGSVQKSSLKGSVAGRQAAPAKQKPNLKGSVAMHQNAGAGTKGITSEVGETALSLPSCAAASTQCHGDHAEAMRCQISSEPGEGDPSGRELSNAQQEMLALPAGTSQVASAQDIDDLLESLLKPVEEDDSQVSHHDDFTSQSSGAEEEEEDLQEGNPYVDSVPAEMPPRKKLRQRPDPSAPPLSSKELWALFNALPVVNLDEER